VAPARGSLLAHLLSPSHRCSHGCQKILRRKLVATSRRVACTRGGAQRGSVASMASFQTIRNVRTAGRNPPPEPSQTSSNSAASRPAIPESARPPKDLTYYWVWRAIAPTKPTLLLRFCREEIENKTLLVYGVFGNRPEVRYIRPEHRGYELQIVSHYGCWYSRKRGWSPSQNPLHRLREAVRAEAG